MVGGGGGTEYPSGRGWVRWSPVLCLKHASAQVVTEMLEKSSYLPHPRPELVCVCVCVRACVHTRANVCVCVRARVCVCARACVHACCQLSLHLLCLFVSSYLLHPVAVRLAMSELSRHVSVVKYWTFHGDNLLIIASLLLKPSAVSHVDMHVTACGHSWMLPGSVKVWYKLYSLVRERSIALYSLRRRLNLSSSGH